MIDNEQFENLDPQEQEKVFRESSVQQRGELLLRCHEPEKLTQRLSQEEFYLITREMDLEERSEIIKYANLPQLFFVSDIECWKKDRLDGRGFLRWLETLAGADDQILLAWLMTMDYETVVAGLKELIHITKPEWEYATDENLGDQHYFTLDQYYFVFVKEENIEIVKRAIEVLYENQREKYTVLMEGTLSELDYEVEEEAYRKRSVRLAERGFPDRETAFHIYQRITREDFEKFPLKNLGQKTGSVPHVSANAPNYLALWSAERSFLDDVLTNLKQEPAVVGESILEEMAWLSNKVISCEGFDFTRESEIRKGVERAKRIVSLGLELLSGGDLPKAVQLIKERWIEIIFRRAITEIMKLRDEARAVIDEHWEGNRKAFLAFLDYPYQNIFLGLFDPLPLCFDKEATGHPQHLRDFKSIRDLERTRVSIRQIRKIHDTLENKYPKVFHDLLRRQNGSATELTLLPLLGTSFAAYALRGKPSIRPLSEADLREFIKKGFEKNGTHKILKSSLKKEFQAQFTGKDGAGLETLWSLAFQGIEEEFSRLRTTEKVDLRFISSVLVHRKDAP